MKFQDWMLDKRVIERNIRKKVLTRKDYERYLKSLPDVSDCIADPAEEEEQEEKSEETGGEQKDESGDA